MNTSPIYQLIANTPERTVTLSVSADRRNLAEAASVAIGRQGWTYSDLTVVTWHDGESTSPVAWSEF